MRRWRGLKQLVHDAVDRTTELVEEGHESGSRAVMRVLGAIEPLAEPARAVDEVRRRGTRGLLGAIRGVNRAVQGITDIGLDVAEQALGARDQARGGPRGEIAVPMRSDAVKSARWLGDAALGLVNGAIGDALHARANGLELEMRLRYGDAYLDLDADDAALAAALAGATGRLAIFVHGLATTEWSWCLESAAYHGDPGASFGSLLARDLGFTPIYVRYNTGRHVSESGRTLAEILERLVRAYPAALDEIVLVGHSMGGLVVRSASHYGAAEGHAWVAKVRRVFCLGTPHAGAPLAKLGHVAAAVLDAIDTPGTQIPARILKARSAGIKDLRGGALVDEDWLGRDPDALRGAATRAIPLLDHVTYHFVSATITEDPRHPLGHLIGDLLVRVPSALGGAIEARAFPIEARHYGGVVHHKLQNHPAVYAQLRDACAGAS